MTPFTFSPAYILPTGIAQGLWKNTDIWRNLPWNITLCYYSLLDNYLSENSVTDLWFWEEHTCCSTLLRFTLFNLFWELEQNAIERCMGRCVVERISGWCVFVTSASIILGPIRDAAFPKMDEFAENFQTASDPSPHPFFGKLYGFFCNKIFRGGATPLFLYRKKRNKIFRIGNDPPPPSEVFRKFMEFGTDSHP